MFPYAPRPPTQPKVNTALKQNHCPRYYTRYDDGEALIVVLQKGQCEMIIDKYAIQESMSIEGQAVAGPNNKSVLHNIIVIWFIVYVSFLKC